jgi:hypothetical protein
MLDVGKTVNEAERFMSICHGLEQPIVVGDAIMQEARDPGITENKRLSKSNGEDPRGP